MEKIGTAELDLKLGTAPFILLDFSSPGCVPCKKIARELPSLLSAMNPVSIEAFEVDITTDPSIASRFLVLGVPTLILLKEGREIARFNSLPKMDTLKRLLS
ncbi:MAG: thioredoxin family protein [Candidatus Aminicenantes bacterium]|nr:thioredoxin family protein [Candidatus Aminicenantes bacterium]